MRCVDGLGARVIKQAVVGHVPILLCWQARARASKQFKKKCKNGGAAKPEQMLLLFDTFRKSILMMP